MATGLANKLVGQVGEFLVCAELGRRGYIATPFSGNVPGFDVIVIGPSMRAVPIQVKTIGSGDFRFDLANYYEVSLDEKREIQRIGSAMAHPDPDLLYILVWLGQPPKHAERFCVCTYRDVQQLVYEDASKHLALHKGHRPKNWRSTSGCLRAKRFEGYWEKWDLVTSRLSKKQRR